MCSIRNGFPYLFVGSTEIIQLLHVGWPIDHIFSLLSPKLDQVANEPLGIEETYGIISSLSPLMNKIGMSAI